MRHKLPVDGDIRTRKVFLFFPLAIEGEERWLEWAAVVQRYTVSGAMGSWMNWYWDKSYAPAK